MLREPFGEIEDPRRVLDDRALVEDPRPHVHLDAHDAGRGEAVAQVGRVEELLLVDAELARLAAHGEPGALDPERRVDAQHDAPGRPTACASSSTSASSGSDSTDDRAYARVEARDELVPALAGAEEQDVLRRDARGERGAQLREGRHLGVRAERVQQPADADVGVRLERVEDPQRGVQPLAQRPVVRGEHVAVVHVHGGPVPLRDRGEVRALPGVVGRVGVVVIGRLLRRGGRWAARPAAP